MDPLTAAIIGCLVAAPVLKKDWSSGQPDTATLQRSIFDLPGIAYQQQLAAWEAQIRAHYDAKIARAQDPDLRKQWKEEQDRLKADKRPRFQRLRDWADRNLPTEEELDNEPAPTPLVDRLRDWWNSRDSQPDPDDEPPSEPDAEQPPTADTPEPDGDEAQTPKDSEEEPSKAPDSDADPGSGNGEGEQRGRWGDWWHRWRRDRNPGGDGSSPDGERVWVEDHGWFGDPPGGSPSDSAYDADWADYEPAVLTPPPRGLSPGDQSSPGPGSPPPGSAPPAPGTPQEGPPMTENKPASPPAPTAAQPAAQSAKPAPLAQPRQSITERPAISRLYEPPVKHRPAPSNGGTAAPARRTPGDSGQAVRLSDEQKVYIQQQAAQAVGVQCIALSTALQTMLATLIRMECGENRLTHARTAHDHVARAALSMHSLWKELGIDDATVGEAHRARRDAAKHARHYT